MISVKKEIFTCKRDELTIRGHIWGDSSPGSHAVILSHGFLANEKMCRKYAKLIAGLGFPAVTYDFCGGGVICRSDGRSQDMTVLSEKADLLAVIEAVKTRLAPGCISLLGCSQGGLVSAMAAKELAGRIKTLILFYPALCIPDDARKGKMMFYRFDPDNIPDILGRFPMKLGGDYARTVIGKDPYELIGGFNGPVLYLHGTKDKVVDISYARQAVKLYENCEYHEIAGGGHMFRGACDKQACEWLAGFMKTYR